jgi:hypothetical protein
VPDDGPDAETRAPAPEQWLVIFEPAAWPGGPPMVARMKALLKECQRYRHLRVVRVCNNVPHPDFEPVEFSEGPL